MVHYIGETFGFAAGPVPIDAAVAVDAFGATSVRSGALDAWVSDSLVYNTDEAFKLYERKRGSVKSGTSLVDSSAIGAAW